MYRQITKSIKECTFDKKSLDALLEVMAECKVRLWLEGDTLNYSAPMGVMTDEFKEELRFHKQEIVEFLKHINKTTEIIKLKKVDRTIPIPASSEQTRLWYMEQLESNSAYSLPLAIRIKGKINQQKIMDVLTAIGKRHEAFRTRFVWKDSVLTQQITNESLLEIHSINVKEEMLDSYLQKLVAEPLHCNTVPIGRAYILHLANDDHVLLLVVHHIISDGWSSSVIAKDIVTGLTEGVECLTPKQFDFVDFCALRKEQDDSEPEKLNLSSVWWKAQLANAPGLSTFPWDIPRRVKRSGRMGVISWKMPHDISMTFDHFLEREHLSAFSVFNAIQGLAVAAMSAHTDVVVGTPVANRRGPQEIEDCVGFFANTIACRYILDMSKDIRSYLKHYNIISRDAIVHQSYPFEQAVEDSGVIRDTAFLPLVQTIMVVQDLPLASSPKSGLEFSSVPLSPPVASFDWVTQAWQQKGIWHLHCEYDADLYSAKRAEDILHAIVETLKNSIASPDSNLMTVAESCISMRTKDRVLRSVESAAAHYAPEARKITLLRAAADNSPVISLFMENMNLSWEQRIDLCKELSNLAGIPVEIVPLLHPRLTQGGDVDMAALLTAPMVPPDKIELLEKSISQGRLVPVMATPQKLPDYDLKKISPELLSTQSTGQFRLSPLVEIPPNGEAHLVGEFLKIQPEIPKTVPEALMRTARCFPTKELIIISSGGKETHLTYAELCEKGLSVASGLIKHGIEKGSFVILQVPDMDLYFPALWGCLFCGVTPVTISYPHKASENDAVFMKLVNAWKLLKQPVILHQADNKEFLEKGRDIIGSRDLHLIDIETLVTFQPLEHPVSVDDNDIAFLQLTSGSTGVAKGVQIRQRGIAVHVASTKHFNGYEENWTSLNWLPYDHVGALLTYHLADSWIGCNQVIVPTDLILKDPGEWLRLLESKCITRSWSPNFGFKLLLNYAAKNPEKNWDLSALRFFMNGGEQVTPSVLREFERFLARNGAPPNVMQPAFGMAEACSTVCYENAFSTDEAIRSYDRGMLETGRSNGDIVELVSLGSAVPNIELKIIGSRGNTLPERRIGRFLIRGEVVTPGYYENHTATTGALIGEGWLDSGDLAFIDRGRLFMTGRAKETIVLNGINYYCHELEDLLNNIRRVRPTWVAAIGARVADAESEELGLFFVPDLPGLSQDDLVEVIATIKLKIIEYFGIVPRWCLPLPKHDFPKGTSGKIQRSTLRKELEKGTYDALIHLYEQNTKIDNEPPWIAVPVEVADNGIPCSGSVRFRRLILTPDMHDVAIDSVLHALTRTSPLLIAIPNNNLTSRHLYGAVTALAESAFSQKPDRDIRCVLTENELDKTLDRETLLCVPSGTTRIYYDNYGQRKVVRLSPVMGKDIASGSAVDLSLPTLILGGFGGIGSMLAEDILKRGKGSVFIAIRTLEGRNKAIHDRLSMLGGNRLIVFQLDETGGLPPLSQSMWVHGGLAINAAGGGADTTPLSVVSVQSSIEEKNAPAAQLEKAMAQFPAVKVVHIGSITGFLGGIGVEAYAAAHGWLDAQTQTQKRHVIAFSQWRNIGVSSDRAPLDPKASHGMRSLMGRRAVRLFWLALKNGAPLTFVGVDLTAHSLLTRSTIMPTFADSWAIVGISGDDNVSLTDVAGRTLVTTTQDICAEAMIEQHRGTSIRLNSSQTSTSANNLEQHLTALWSEILGHDYFSVTDNFFSVGGSSLLLMRLHKGVEELTGRSLPMTLLYKYHSISTLGNYLTCMETEHNETPRNKNLTADRSNVLTRGAKRAALRKRSLPRTSSNKT